MKTPLVLAYEASLNCINTDYYELNKICNIYPDRFANVVYEFMEQKQI